MLALHPILVVFAFVFLVLAAFGVPGGRVQFGWLGLAVLTLTFLVR